MEHTQALTQRIQDGSYDSVLSYLHPGAADLSRHRQRLCQVAETFRQQFGDQPVRLFSAPGRTEIGGNHTDHQHGCVVGASVDLDIVCAACPNGTNTVRILSEGYPMEEVDLSDLEVHPEDYNRSRALIRGVAAGLRERGFAIGGFDATMTSDVLGGSGLSSSAAYEVLLGTLFSCLFNDNAVTPIQVAQIGQYAENKYFGKPCGLLDQMSCSVGGFVAMDFYNPAAPMVDKVDFDFATTGYVMCIVDSRADHADLTDDYAAITRENRQVAQFFGKEVLRQVPAQDFYANLAQLRQQVCDRAILRAHHFFQENLRAQQIAQALREHDFASFLKLSAASGRSSFMYLQNIYSASQPLSQGVSVALAATEHLLQGQGAFRIHGGGFGGTIQVFVPQAMVEDYRQGIDAVLGEGACHLLSIRPVGGIELVGTPGSN